MVYFTVMKNAANTASTAAQNAFVYQTVDRYDKSIAIHRCSSWIAGYGISNCTGRTPMETSFKVTY
jgi:hypothetical protein